MAICSDFTYYSKAIQMLLPWWSLCQPQPPRDMVSFLPIHCTLPLTGASGWSLCEHCILLQTISAASVIHLFSQVTLWPHGRALGLWESHTHFKLPFFFCNWNNAHIRGSLRIKRQSSWPMLTDSKHSRCRYSSSWKPSWVLYSILYITGVKYLLNRRKYVGQWELLFWFTWVDV